MKANLLSRLFKHLKDYIYKINTLYSNDFTVSGLSVLMSLRLLYFHFVIFYFWVVHAIIKNQTVQDN